MLLEVCGIQNGSVLEVSESGSICWPVLVAFLHTVIDYQLLTSSVLCRL